MQRMRHRLARHPEPVGELVLPDALAGVQRAVGDRLQDPRIDLVDQVRKRVERDHAGSSEDDDREYGIPYSKVRREDRGVKRGQCGVQPRFALRQAIDIAGLGYCAWGCFEEKEKRGGAYSARNAFTASPNSSGACSNIQWPALGITTVLAPAMCAASTRHITDRLPVVAPPPIRSVGVLIACASASV